MMRSQLRGLPVFWQTLGLLLSALLIVQGVGFALLFLLPPPRPEFTRMSDLAATLQGLSGSDDREQPLRVSHEAQAPVRPANLMEEPVLTRQLAARLHRPPSDVRLYAEPDRGPGFPFARRSQRPHPWRERLFFGRIVAAVAEQGGWLVVTTPAPPLVQPWQRRMMLWFAIAATALVPLAWISARAASRQIRRFAEAADRLGADTRAAPMAERGSAELQVAARAFNRMQGRLSEYLDERTAMIGAIAHDLRTPLARIAFRVEAAPDPVRDRVLGDVAQMQAMISATIGFVRNTGERGQRVPLDLSELIHSLAVQEQELGRSVTLGVTEPALIAGDPIALERLIQNLINNGVGYGGSVQLSVQRCGTMARLLCVDHGPGLPADLLERVFQPFVRADPSRNRATGGIGLGLTIARTIAEDHGGNIRLENRQGGGLEARLELPLAPFARPITASAPIVAAVSG